MVPQTRENTLRAHNTVQPEKSNQRHKATGSQAS